MDEDTTAEPIERIEEFDRVVAMLLEGAEVSTTDDDVRALVDSARLVMFLPQDSFRERLRLDLERKASTMRATETDRTPFREGFHTITPYLVAKDALGVIEFVKSAFGGVETHQSTGTGGGLHAEVRLDDSMMMIGGGEAFESRPAEIHVYVEDADATYERAIGAGGESLYGPMDMPYGGREAGVKDSVGNHWYIGTHPQTGKAPRGMRAVTPVLHPRDLERQIRFLEDALAAHDVVRDEAPDGSIVHATARVGDSVVELGPVHGQWQPMPGMFFLYVDDVDEWYRRATEAGAESVQAPRNEPYGDRVGAVKDTEGNLWYLGTPIR
jgi:uncharacterized glyoxalase superfamily protein PhnB